jgi:hypothetical protein
MKLNVSLQRTQESITSPNHNYTKLRGLSPRAKYTDRLCGLVVRVSGYRSKGPGSIPGSTSLSEK